MCFDFSETPPINQMLKLKQNKDMEEPIPPLGNPSAGRKCVSQATEWYRHKKHPRSVSHPADSCVS